MKKQKEIWVDSYYFSEKYEVSNLGNVRNKKTQKIYKFYKNEDGYEMFTLTNKKKRITTRIHRLVYLSFNPNTPLYLNIHHLDHNRCNNKLSNLGAIDHRTHASIHAKLRISSGTFHQHKMGSQNILYKGRVIGLCPTTFQIKYIMCGSYEIRKAGFSDSGISMAVNGILKKYKGLLFKRISDDLNVEIGQIYDYSKI